MYFWIVRKLINTLKIVGVLIVLAIFWLFYFLLQLTYGSPNNENHNYIPENAHLVVAFNGDLALKSVLSDFISTQDEALLEKINSSKDEMKQSTGINFLSDIIYFNLNEKNEELTGLLFNLTSEKDFKSNFEGSVIASNNSVGIILFNSNISKSKEKLKSIATKLMDKPTELYANHLSEKRIPNAYVSFWSKNINEKSDWKYAQLDVNKNEININGEIFIDGVESQKTNKIAANSSSLNVSSAQFPKQFNDSILSWIGIDSNQIIGVSANYRSLKIEQENSFEIVPDADFIYQFHNEVDVLKILEKLETNAFISKITPNDFIYGGKRFEYKQIDAKTIYIGRTKFSEIAFQNSTSIFSMNGQPNYLSVIEGNSFILRVISIFPAYRAGKNLSNSIVNVDFKVVPISTNVFKINGKIEFGKGKYASIELIRNLLELRQ